MRKISRAENRDRETIARIVRGNETQLYLAEMRKTYLGLGQDAIDGVRKKLQKGSDVWFNRQVLMDMGAVPSAKELELLLAGDSQTGNRVFDIVQQAADSIAGDAQKGDYDQKTDEPDDPPGNAPSATP
jgi:hypothetical protein